MIIFIVIFALIALSFNMHILRKINKFVPTHKVKLLTNSDGLSLREEPNSNYNVFAKIENGTEIQHISTGEEVKMGDVNGNWFKIKTKENIYGWCFSGSLEKI